MQAVSRRGFVQAMGATAGVGWLASPTAADGRAPEADTDRSVYLSGDGVGLSPRGYASLLDELARRPRSARTTTCSAARSSASSSTGPTLLGKETAVFMPSGTLANQLALRALAGPKRRVIVPEMSHVYNDTGDACQTLSGLTLMPLAPGAATFTRADVEAVLARTAGGRVATDVGAILIESPIRRLSGQMFDWDEAKRIAAFARERGIGTHLDGARLFIASAYTGISPGRVRGAVRHRLRVALEVLQQRHRRHPGRAEARARRHVPRAPHVRRQPRRGLAGGAGGAALHGRLRRLAEERRARLRGLLLGDREAPDGDGRARPERHEPGAGDAEGRRPRGGSRSDWPSGASRSRAAPPSGIVTLGVNETWNRTTGAELARAFEQALG